ncbi:MAG: hypothetical protein IPM91_09490 [Bacteroidetes bacterium]|nr:hypothetical protein [Bacteroidota bacterium]
MLTINRIIAALEKSDATGYKSSFKLSKLIVFSMGKIPAEERKHRALSNRSNTTK